MNSTVTKDLHGISVDEARSAIACISEYIKNANKEIDNKTYPGVEVFKNRHLLISHSDSVKAILDWINRHEEKTQLVTQ